MSHIKTIHQLNSYCSGQLFCGRAKTKYHAKVPSVQQFNRKLAYIDRVASEGCPIANKVLLILSRKMDTLRQQLVTRTRVLENREYPLSAIGRPMALSINYIYVDAAQFQPTTQVYMELLGLYDQYYLALVSDEFKRSRRLRKYQKEGVKMRRKLRGCINLALRYEDGGIRGEPGERDIKKKNYIKMVKIYGEPVVTKTPEKLLAVQ